MTSILCPYSEGFREEGLEVTSFKTHSPDEMLHLLFLCSAKKKIRRMSEREEYHPQGWGFEHRGSWALEEMGEADLVHFNCLLGTAQSHLKGKTLRLRNCLDWMSLWTCL